MNLLRYTVLLICFLSLALISCSEEKEPPAETLSEPEIVAVSEVYQTARDTLNNVDTPAIWHSSSGETWLLATAKETDVVLAYDASTGERLHVFSEEGTGKGQLDRPNSIAVVDDFAVVVERDNHRIQVFVLPAFESLGFFGEQYLVKPYGLSILKNQDDSYRLFVTDNYETEDEKVPPPSELNRRVHEFSFSIGNDNMLNHSHVKAFGDTTGEGVLMVVESIMADPAYNRLLISDEDSVQNNLKVYTLDGEFTGEIVGEGLFKYEPEGIALYACEDNSGYWIATDQSVGDNRFHVFDRETLTLLATFTNPNTTNTDGITITQKGFTNFESGGFFPIHNDGNVSAISWAELANTLGLKTCMMN